MVDPLLYNTTLSQAFSPCGNFLLAGNNYGNVAVYDLQKIFSHGDGTTASQRKPSYTFSASQGRNLPVCSMVTTDKFLLIGLVGEIGGFEWSAVTTTKHPKAVWTMHLPTNKDALGQPDVNALAFASAENLVYAGCGDNMIYGFSLEDGKLVRTLVGHTDYVHSIDHVEGQLASGGEDGWVRLWDRRQQTSTNQLQPCKQLSAARPQLGQWIGAVALNDEWLMCGGGPRLGLWSLRTLDLMVAVPLDDQGVHVCSFYDDHLMCGGAGAHLYHLNYAGDVQAQIPTSSATTYSVVHQDAPHKVLCIAGASNKIDVCTNFNYKDFQLTFS